MVLYVIKLFYKKYHLKFYNGTIVCEIYTKFIFVLQLYMKVKSDHNCK